MGKAGIATLALVLAAGCGGHKDVAKAPTQLDGERRCLDEALPRARHGAAFTAAMWTSRAGTDEHVLSCIFDSDDATMSADPALAPIRCADGSIVALIPWVGPREVFQIDEAGTVTRTQPRPDDKSTPCADDA
jgi:hypothetical protein